jgi:integrase
MPGIAGVSLGAPRHVLAVARANVRTLGSVYQRKGIWYIRFRYRGREYRESSKSTKQKDALELLQRRRAEIVSGHLRPANERTTFDDLARLIEADYATNGRRSAVDMRGRLSKLRAKLGKALPVDVTHKMLLDYVQKRRAEGAAPATIRYEIIILGRMYTLAIHAGLLTDKPPMPTIKVRNTRTGFFEPNEIKRVLAALPEDLRPAIEFAYLTGWRIGEIKTLKWAQIDVQACLVRLEPGTTKNEEGRTFPFGAHPRLGTLLVNQMERTVSLQRQLGKIIPWVFWWDGNPLKEFRRTWKGACATAGCPGRLVHDLRRTAVRNLVRAGVTERVAMQLTGHKTRAVFDRYDIVSESDLNAAVKKLAERESGS